MSGFEYLFTFYGLLLGLAVANVATGLADMWRGHAQIRAGWTTPLLGLFIMLGAAQQWVSFWGGRDEITMGPSELLVSIGVALPFIFISQAMYPREEGGWASLEDYYLAHSRVFMAVLLVPPLAGLFYNVLRYGLWPNGAALLFLGLRVAIPLALMFVRNAWAHRAGIAILCLAMLTALFYFFE